MFSENAMALFDMGLGDNFLSPKIQILFGPHLKEPFSQMRVLI